MDKLRFIDISFLEQQHNIMEAKQTRGVFGPRYLLGNFVKFEGEEHNPDAFDILPYVELTQFQCQIICDNIIEVVRFADRGRTK